MTNTSDRSYEPIEVAGLQRLARTAEADLDAFFSRNPHRGNWHSRIRLIAFAQGGAEHYLRRERGVRDC